MSEADVVGVAKSTLAGLEAAHADRLVHRDLKPDNIFLAKTPGVGDVVKILDFGIAKLLDGDSAAKLTATGLVIGTPLYMSPEQARGDDLDHRSDLYSLGAVMYEALTGTPPFTGRNYNALLVAVLTNTPRPIQELRPDISPELADVVMRALSKERAHRFADAAEMSAALSSFTPKTDAPPSREELGLASTMATPQVGSVKPANVTPIAGGVGTPVPTREASTPAAGASAGGAPAAADTAPMTETAKPKKTRSHGWLVAMAFVALLAGVGGTWAFVQSSPEEGGAVATAAMPAAQVEPMDPAATGTPPAVVPVTPTAAEAASTDDGRAALAETGADEAMPEGGDDTEEPEEEEARPARTKRPRMRRPAGRIVASGGTFARHREHRESGFRDYANWSSCWPRGMPFPEMNRGLDIRARSNPDGTLTNLEPGGSNLYPVIAECIMRLMQGATIGPAEDGQGHDVRLSFTFYPNTPPRRRRRR
jgi:serine/threonine-protein kinase